MAKSGFLPENADCECLLQVNASAAAGGTVNNEIVGWARRASAGGIVPVLALKRRDFQREASCSRKKMS
jgi:hypothetical protein